MHHLIDADRCLTGRPAPRLSDVDEGIHPVLPGGNGADERRPVPRGDGLLKAAALRLLVAVAPLIPVGAHAQAHDTTSLVRMERGAMQSGDGSGAKSSDPRRTPDEEPAEAAAPTTGPALEPVHHGPTPDADGDDVVSVPLRDRAGADEEAHLRVLIDRLEAVHGRQGHGQALEAYGWYGGDLDKLWLKVDGERSNGEPGSTRAEALWDHVFAQQWSLQGGMRRDFGEGPGRTWAALGLRALSPQWCELQLTAYFGEGGRTALRLEAEDALRIHQRLLLQPDVKVEIFGQNDLQRGVGAGLSEIEIGLRLRYAFSRTVSPYVGVVWTRKFGNTARDAREDGAMQKSEAVVGIRLRF